MNSALGNVNGRMCAEVLQGLFERGRAHSGECPHFAQRSQSDGDSLFIHSTALLAAPCKVATMDTIPEEILSDILGYCLYQPPDHLLGFSTRWRDPSLKLPDTGPQPLSSSVALTSTATSHAHTESKHKGAAKQPLPPPTPRSSLLRVSKQWLRVSSPFFYCAVKLSASEDLRTLRALFIKHPCLGYAVRTLRIESADFADLTRLLKLVPNVKTVYVSLQLLELQAGEEHDGGEGSPTDDDRGGGVAAAFVGAMHELNPTRLFVWKKFGRSSSLVDEIETALGEAVVPRWTQLVSLLPSQPLLRRADPPNPRLIPHQTHVAFSQQYEVPPPMSQSLRVLPRLRTLRMGGHGALCSLMNGSLQVIAENPGLGEGAVSCEGSAAPLYVVECKRMFPGRAAGLLAVGSGV